MAQLPLFEHITFTHKSNCTDFPLLAVLTLGQLSKHEVLFQILSNFFPLLFPSLLVPLHPTMIVHLSSIFLVCYVRTKGCNLV